MREYISQSYILRLWQDHRGAPWRATLIAVAQATEHHHFSNLDDLLTFLIAQTSGAESASTEHLALLPDGDQPSFYRTGPSGALTLPTPQETDENA